ncbi:uncharacterized protein TRAVEDRAFT_126344, partial [Trametes versicolor FP-101664 SS1]|uniref:uncharacterized protein n=1 Tax=Trametes versicolor (strain FP-101664) TaxID=717944 RepID=UPI0004624281
LCPSKPPSLDPLATFSPRFIAGVILVAAGGGMRISTYRALGSLFTYEVFIKDDHRLVTSGPYRYVRHPSYTGVVLLLLGTHLVHFADGGYATYCGLAATPMVCGVWFWKISAPFSLLSVFRRCPVEDAQLRERFGKEWEKYRQETPYAMLPFLY